MILIFVVAVGLVMAGWNTWQRLGRSRRARAWARDRRPGVARNVLVRWPLLALACVTGAVIGLVEDGPVVAVAIALFLGSMVTFLVYVLFPVPVPDVVKPGWFRELDLPASRTRD